MNNHNLALSWLKNGIVALGIAGLYSVILVLLRVPQLSPYFTDKEIFKSALVIHVNLSVLVWLLSGAAIIWSYNQLKTGFELALARLGLIAMIMIAISPVIGDKAPVMNNYIPMLENLAFIIGLCLFGVSLLCLAIITVISGVYEFRQHQQDYSVFSLAKLSSSIIYLMVFTCFIWSFLELDRISDIVPLDIDFYYELLYWSGGHLLQFLYTQILMLIWFILFELYLDRLKFNTIYQSLLVINFLLGSLVFYGHYNFDIIDSQFKEFFTRHMIYCGGIAPVIFALLLCYEAFVAHRRKVPSFIYTTIICSIFLFFFGGLIGLLITGVNVVIPAHYHGEIVGISIALMGLVYVYCFLKPHNERGIIQFLPKAENIEKYQAAPIYLITLGQLIHITGLALAGGYGVLRKTPGEEIALSAKVYMGMMGIGGLIAIIGGLMFVYICGRKVYFSKVLN